MSFWKKLFLARQPEEIPPPHPRPEVELADATISAVVDLLKRMCRTEEEIERLKAERAEMTATLLAEMGKLPDRAIQMIAARLTTPQENA